MSLKVSLDKINLRFLNEMVSLIHLCDGITQEDAVHIFMILQNSAFDILHSKNINYSPDKLMLAQEKFIRKSLKIIFHGIGEIKNV